VHPLQLGTVPSGRPHGAAASTSTARRTALGRPAPARSPAAPAQAGLVFPRRKGGPVLPAEAGACGRRVRRPPCRLRVAGARHRSASRRTGWSAGAGAVGPRMPN